MPAAQLLIALAALFWLGLPISGHASTSASVILQLKWGHSFQFAGYYAAQAQGYYRAAGLDVEIRPGSPAIDTVDEVTAGRAQFGIGTSSLLLSREAGARVQVLGVVLQHSPQVLITRVNQPSFKPQQLLGQPIMIEPSAQELYAYLVKENIPHEMLRIEKHSGDITDLASGKVAAMSAYSSYEPFLLNQLGVPFHLSNPREVGIDFYGNNLFTTDALIQSAPQQVDAFRAASFKGWEYALQHREEIIDLIARDYAPQLSREFLAFEAEQLTRLIQPDLVNIGYMTEGRWQHIANTYAGLGLMSPNFPVQKLLFQSANERQLAKTQNALSNSIAAILLISMVSLGIIAYIYRTNQRLHATQAQLRHSEARYRMLTEEMKDVIWAIDVQTMRYSYISPSVLQLRGFSAEEILRSDLPHNLLPETLQAIERLVQHYVPLFEAGTITSEHYETMELEQRHKNGQTLWTEMISHLVINPENGRIELQGITRDITERKRQQAHIEYIAQHDVLTGLANRRLFSEHFSQAHAVAVRDQHPWP